MDQQNGFQTYEADAADLDGPRFLHDAGLAPPDLRGATVMTPEYEKAIKALNEAAHAAVRAGRDTTLMPYIDRQSLREIAVETDRLVDMGARSAMPVLGGR